MSDPPKCHQRSRRVTAPSQQRILRTTQRLASWSNPYRRIPWARSRRSSHQRIISQAILQRTSCGHRPSIRIRGFPNLWAGWLLTIHGFLHGKLQRRRGNSVPFPYSLAGISPTPTRTATNASRSMTLHGSHGVHKSQTWGKPAISRVAPWNLSSTPPMF